MREKNKFLKFSESIVYILFAAIVLYMFLTSLVSTCVMVYTDEHTFYLKDYALVISAGLVCFVALLTFLRKKVKMGERAIRISLIVCTVVWFGILAAIVHFTKLPSVYDQQRVYAGAAALLRGDYTGWQPYNYFHAYPYINGMVLMECPFLWLFGEEQAYIAMQYINILFWYGAVLAISKMAGLCFGKKAGIFTYLALLGFIPMWFYVTFVYGTLPGLFFSALALLLEKEYEMTEKRQYMAGSLICIFFGVAWKSNYQIFLIALLLLFFLEGIRKRRWQPFAGAVACLLLLCFELTFLSAVMHSITGESVEGGTPTIGWVAMGLQESSIAPGWYNSYTEIIPVECDHDVEAMKAAAWQNLRETLTLFAEEPEYCLRFFSRKLASMWNNPAFQCFTEVTKCNTTGTLSYWMKDLLYDGGVKNAVLRVILNLMHSMTLFGMVLHVMLNRKRLKLVDAAFAITFLGGFFFHVVWEAMGQYAVPYYVLLMPYAVQGYLAVTEKAARLCPDKEKGLEEAGRRLWRSTDFRLAMALAVVIVVITFAEFGWLRSSIKLQGEESDYIWYCTHQTEWKEADYKKI
ncbi:hypothetical protein AALA90_00395 [Lachnospiraceae bacterium 38-10]